MSERFSVQDHEAKEAAANSQASASSIEQLELLDAQSGSRVVVAPDRGALVTGFFDGARELLFLDRDSFLDRSKNVRGGIPVLFPSPGKLENDAWAREGRTGSLKQHGFARNSSWKVLRRGTGERAELTLGLESSAETLRDYPWPFRVELTFALREKTLRIEIQLFNTGSESMPYGFGFHPYFHVALEEKAQAKIETQATQAWDNVLKKDRPLGKIELGGSEVDLHLLDHNATHSALTTPSGTINIKGSDAFVRWVIWTLPGKEFVCLEPWTCPGNALNTGAGLRTLEAGADETLWLEISS
jgi:galactose mutarotase-like enzyme